MQHIPIIPHVAEAAHNVFWAAMGAALALWSSLPWPLDFIDIPTWIHVGGTAAGLFLFSGKLWVLRWDIRERRMKDRERVEAREQARMRALERATDNDD